MLIQFSFKNFKVFKEEVLLDFLPASINEHKNTLLKDPADGECILPPYRNLWSQQRRQVHGPQRFILSLIPGHSICNRTNQN